MANTKSRQRHWIIASTLGLAVGLPGGLALGAPLEVLVGAMIVTPLMLGLSGLLLGGSQWVALRDRLPRAVRWIGLTAVGFAAGFTAAVVLVEQGGAWLTGSPVRLSTSSTLGLAASLVAIGVIGGSAVGLAQSFAVRQIEGAVRTWVAFSTLGLTAGFLVGLALAVIAGGLGSPVGLILFLLGSGAVYSLITGRALSRITREAAAGAGA